jgi:hypothetical protein
MMLLPKNRWTAVAKGSLTAANVRIDATTANAFAWLTALNFDAISGAPRDGKTMLGLFNSDGSAAWGIVSSTAPTGDGVGGEALDVELVDAWTNYAPTFSYETWTPGAGNLITQAVNTAGRGAAYKGTGLLTGKLLKCVNSITLNSGTMPQLFHAATAIGDIPKITLTANGTSYMTGIAAVGTISLCSEVATDFGLTAFSFKQVTDPPPPGALLLSSVGGARGYYYKSASFNPNTVASYKIVRLY